MKAKVIYLHSGFWKQLRSDTSIAGLQCTMNVYEAISEANLRTDIEDDVWDSDPFLKMLWKKYLTNQSDVELYEELSIKPENNSEDLTAVYLTEESTNKCEEIGQQYGVIAINNIEMPRKEYLFKGDGFLLKKNAITYKGRFLEFKSKIHYPCNSMIIIDPYLLSKKQNIHSNLYSLLDATLPSGNIKVKFQLSIFSMLGNGNNDAWSGKGEEYYNEIIKIITEIRKGISFSLSLFAVGKAEEFHSRMIITNNVLFRADDGFEVFKENGKASKHASFDIVIPRLVGDNRLDMSNYLRWIKIAKTRSNSQPDNQFWGMRENRLYDLV